MENSVFIVSQGSRYGRKIADKFLANSYRVIKTVTELEDEISETPASGRENMLTELNWNSYSPFSSKNIILNLRQYPDIKYYIILYSIPEETAPFYKQSQTDIQKTIDLYIKSQISITSELINELSRNNKSPNLFLVLGSSDTSNPYKDFFKSFITNILEDAELSKININAFEIGKENPDVFADYVFSTVQDKGIKNRGKWFKQFRYTLF